MSNAQERNKAIIEEFRANEGKVGGHFITTPLLLLHTIGAKSGELRIIPAAYLADGERYVIFSSNAGGQGYPGWYFNVSVNADVIVEVGPEKIEAIATVASEPERTQLFGKMAAINPGFTEYEQKTERVIPVVILTRKP